MNISLLIVLCLGLSVTLVHATTLRSGILIEKDNTAFQYNLIKETVGSFKEASEMCGFAYEGGVLAIVDNREKYDFIVDLVEETDINFYFGLKRQTIPESFSFTAILMTLTKPFLKLHFSFLGLLTNQTMTL